MYDGTLAGRIRERLIAREGYDAKKMFGGICYLLNGNMACGIVRNQLIVRVGKEKYAAALELPHAGVFDFTGRPMTGWVQVGPGGTTVDEDLDRWLQKGVDYALSLPPK